jgi:hypothetical protein
MRRVGRRLADEIEGDRERCDCQEEHHVSP